MAPSDLGVGIDIVSVARIEKILSRWGDRFLSRVYTGREIESCSGKPNPTLSLAARFAAKEAFIKALARWHRGGIGYRSIEVITDSDGVPQVRARGLAARVMEGLSATVSLSHEQDYAVAVVVTFAEVKP